ncbi:GtrA family protein [Dactylosporangium sp. NPDC005572]|uniref:GtrA family protein n=1 Tax=Dactylosporangium sp. NPDC005572 TaxID=3156889 RepID=UPI0033B2FDAF
MRRIWQHSLTRFCLLGMVGFGFDLALLALLKTVTPLPVWAAVTIAFWVTYALNFVLNRYFAFHAQDRPVGPQVLRFVAQVLGDYALTLGAVEGLHALGVPLLVARIAAGGTNLVWNYLLYRFWTFGSPRGDTSGDTSGDTERAGRQDADRPVEEPERVAAHQ